MSAAKIPAIRDRMRQQEILARELGGPVIERAKTAGASAEARRPRSASGERKPARTKAAYRPAHLPGFASLIRKVIAY